MPGIEGIAPFFQQFGKGSGECERCHQIETVMVLSIWRDIFHGPQQEASRRRQSLPVLWMRGVGILELQVNKPPG
jgi:hypothetical protein